jgi:hypothetical protein
MSEYDDPMREDDLGLPEERPSATSAWGPGGAGATSDDPMVTGGLADPVAPETREPGVSFTSPPVPGSPKGFGSLDDGTFSSTPVPEDEELPTSGTRGGMVFSPGANEPTLPEEEGL